MSEDNIMLRFRVVRGGQVVRTEEFDQNVVKIGKLASSHLRLEDPEVSRIHAVIEKGGDGSYSVIDLGSASGTFVNGDKVTKAEISDGDQIKVGETTLELELVEAAQQAQSVEQTTQQGATDGHLAAESSHAQGEEAGGQNTITLEDGTVVEPYTQLGYYDEEGNYIPYWYDQQGQYHPGYGYYDDQGEWQVAHGYYDPDGEWVESEQPVSQVEESTTDTGPTNSELYQQEFFQGSGGDTLEVAMLWADQVLTVTSFAQPRSVTVGPDEENDFLLDDQAFGADIQFPIVAVTGGAYSLVFNERMSGFVLKGDEHYTLAEAIEQGVARRSSMASNAYEVPLDSHTSARLDIGTTTFLVHFTDMPAVLGGSFSVDTAPVPYVAISAVAHLMFLFLAMTLPGDARGLDLDGAEAEDRFVEMMSKPDQEEEEEPDWLEDGSDKEEAAKHKGEEGKAGDEESDQEDKHLEIEGDAEDDPELKEERDTEIAKNTGVEAVFSDNQISSMWGDSDKSVGSDAQHALGNLQGEEGGEAKGFGGLGLAGGGRGGGGTSEKGIGMANVGTAGRGGGGEGGDGYGAGKGDLGDKGDKMPEVVPENPAVEGSLDKEIIRRVVRQHRREIAYCYEKELQKNKTLEGRVKVKFVISGSGDVISAQVSNTSLNNRSVESCVTSKIQRWVFPEPKGGGIVEVNYPFNFTKQ